MEAAHHCRLSGFLLVALFYRHIHLAAPFERRHMEIRVAHNSRSSPNALPVRILLSPPLPPSQIR